MSPLVKILSQTSLSLFLQTIFYLFFFGSFAPPPLSSTPPDQTLSCVTDTCREVTGSTPLAQTLTDKATQKSQQKELFMWLALLHHWWNGNFLATRRNVSASRLGAVVLTLADVIGCLLCQCYASYSLFCCFVIWIKRVVHWIWLSNVTNCVV